MRITILGQGVLSWPAGERISDRYGLVILGENKPADSWGNFCGDNTMDETQVKRVAGKIGMLVAVVLETRQSHHIGDMFRNIGPTTPAVGEEIELGSGTLFIDRFDMGHIGVGLNPMNGSTHDWLDPHKLYRAHDQTVRLEFREA